MKHDNQPIFEEVHEYDVKEFNETNCVDKGRFDIGQDLVKDLKTLLI